MIFMSIEIIGIKDFPLIKENDNLPEIIYNSLINNKITLVDSDVLVLAETVVSKAEGNYVKVEDVIVSEKAKEMSIKSGKDAKQCQIILDNPLPKNPDESARKIKKFLDKKFGIESKVIISDTQGRAWRVGAIGVAVGISGLHPTTDFRGTHDLYGQELMSTIEGTADELASAASLIMGQSDNGMCLVLIRGYESGLTSCGLNDASINEIIRDKKEDAFR